jgi:hypothetical protein
MKTKITLLYVQYNKRLNTDNENYIKLFFDDENELPSVFASTKSEKETLKEICSKYFKLDSNWTIKQLADFRIIKDSKYPYTFVSEAVYIIYAPEIAGILNSGKLLSFKQINDLEIELDNFYEQAIARSGTGLFR